MYGETSETKIGTGAPADRAERASGCQERQSNIFERPSEAHSRSPILKTHHITGMKFWDMPLRRPLTEEQGKFPVPGLRIFMSGSGQSRFFEFVSTTPLDESDAIDAQCRAGWDERAYDFYDFKTTKLEDGSFVAVWKARVCGE